MRETRVGDKLFQKNKNKTKKKITMEKQTKKQNKEAKDSGNSSAVFGTKWGGGGRRNAQCLVCPCSVSLSVCHDRR